MKVVRGLITPFLIVLSVIFFAEFKTYADALPEEAGTYLNLSVTETKELDQDLLTAMLRYEVEVNNPKEAQNMVNQTMKKALEVTSKSTKLQVVTDQYYVYKFYKPVKVGETQKEIWRASQGITIKSKDSDELLAVAGKLQDIGLLMSNMYHEVSQEKAEQERNLMIENAVNKLMAKAKKVADLIGSKEIKIKNISFNGDNYYPVPYPVLMRSAAVMGAAESVSDPVSSAGKTSINLTISATVLLKESGVK